MEIMINEHKKIQAIQDEFSANFPYLRLEVYANVKQADGTIGKRVVHDTGKTLAECRTVHGKGRISISPGMTVNNLERNFRDVFGVKVQVLRKSGRAWLETTLTDGWTLEEQNRQGEELSRPAA
jgi:hypothetical protein